MNTTKIATTIVMFAIFPVGLTIIALQHSLPTIYITLLWLASVPYILSPFSFHYREQLPGGFDNNNPRVQQQQLTGVGARILGAQKNAWEALAFTTPFIAVAYFRGVDMDSLTVEALIILAARGLHSVAYIADNAAMRSGVFAVAQLTCFYIFYQAVVAS